MPMCAELRGYFREVLKPAEGQQKPRGITELRWAALESKVLTNDEVVERIEHGDVQDLNYMFITTCVLTSAQQSHFVLNHCLTPFFHSDEAFMAVIHYVRTSDVVILDKAFKMLLI